MPVAGAQVLTVQMPLPAVSHVTIVAALTLQLYGSADVSHSSVPLHRLSSSCAAQSLFCVQPQELAPLVHAPAAQTSPTVQPLPSSQALVLLTCVQPLSGLQASLVQTLPSSQNTATTTAVPLHAPPAHASLVVQALPSLQDRALLLWAQPVAGEQESLVQMLLSSQLTLLPPQKPPLQVSFWLHALPSLQASVLLAKTQLPLAASQVSLVHGLPSLHTATAPGLQAPVAQMSPTVQALPSVHGEVLLLCWQPSVALHESLVHGLPSSQLRLAPGLHAPAAQTSGEVQTLLSALHGPFSFWLT